MDGRGSVLLVDDEETFREATSRLLRREGFDCHSAAMPTRASRSSGPPIRCDDCRYPNAGQSGSAARAQSAQELDRQMPVILVTGYPSTETAIRSIDLSVMAYLTKPVEFHDLLRHVKLAIARRGIGEP